MTSIAFYPKKQKAGDGFNVFYPEAQKFLAHHEDKARRVLVEVEAQRMTGIVPVAEKSAALKARRAQVKTALSALADSKAYTSNFAFFCHGWRTGMQFGFDLRSVGELAEHIHAASGNQDPNVFLYSCSCGSGDNDGDGGFADKLRDELCKLGSVNCLVVAHATAGHATSNPYVREFNGNGSPVGGTGGQWIVAPGSELWEKWRKALRTTNLRFELASGIEYIHGKLVK